MQYKYSSDVVIRFILLHVLMLNLHIKRQKKKWNNCPVLQVAFGLWHKTYITLQWKGKMNCIAEVMKAQRWKHYKLANGLKTYSQLNREGEMPFLFQFMTQQQTAHKIKFFSHKSATSPHTFILCTDYRCKCVR